MVLTQSSQTAVYFDGGRGGGRRDRWERIKAGGNLKRSLKYGSPLCRLHGLARQHLVTGYQPQPPAGLMLQSNKQRDQERQTWAWGVCNLLSCSLWQPSTFWGHMWVSNSWFREWMESLISDPNHYLALLPFGHLSFWVRAPGSPWPAKKSRSSSQYFLSFCSMSTCSLELWTWPFCQVLPGRWTLLWGQLHGAVEPQGSTDPYSKTDPLS